MEALRKAYAEIMLNTTKESAARVLAAEERAAVLEGRVAAAKEDGVAALVRLKAIMEARIKEVESKSLAHVRKINELQEQLHGAQNTVASLQVELQTANTELEQTRTTLAEERNNILPTCDEMDSNKNRSSCSKMHVQSRSVSLKNKDTADDICCVPTSTESGAAENRENVCGTDVSSIARNKKSKLYRYGCTQRIRALKRRSPRADSSEQNGMQASVLNIRSKMGKNNTARNTRRTRSIMEQILETEFQGNCKRKRGQRRRPSYKHDSSEVHGKTEDTSSDASDKDGCLQLLKALEQDLSPPNMFTRHSGEGLTDRKDYLPIGGKDAPALIEAPALSKMQIVRRKRTKTVRISDDGYSLSKSAPGNTLRTSTNKDTIFKSEQTSESIDNHSDTPASKNVSGLSVGTENLMHPSDGTENLMYPSDDTENLKQPSDATENSMHPSDHIENLMQSSDTTESLMHPNIASTGQFESGNSSPLVLQSTKRQIDSEGELRVDHPKCRTPETNSAGWQEVKVDESCNLALDRSGPSAIISLDKEQNAMASGVPVQPGGARRIQYTFNRRKRKSMSLDSTPQGAIPEKGSSLVNLTDKQESQALPGKSSNLVNLADKQESQALPETQNLLVESPQDDSELVHVAQQLVLLSELKW